MTISTERLWCVVPAAGRGARFGGGVPKQYLPIGGKPMLLWTLERLAAQPLVVGVVVVLAAGDPLWPGVAGAAASLFGANLRTAIGGAARADSVLAGLAALSDVVRGDDFVLVHDAARPCVRAEDIARLIELASAADGGLLAARVRDTLKRADESQRVATTEPREARWRALTPQMFRHRDLVDALESARAAGIEPTDEAMAMERAGHRPLLVEGSESNIKVTTPDDLDLAGWFLDRAARGS